MKLKLTAESSQREDRAKYFLPNTVLHKIGAGSHASVWLCRNNSGYLTQCPYTSQIDRIMENKHRFLVTPIPPTRFSERIWTNMSLSVLDSLFSKTSEFHIGKLWIQHFENVFAQKHSFWEFKSTHFENVFAQTRSEKDWGSMKTCVCFALFCRIGTLS